MNHKCAAHWPHTTPVTGWKSLIQALVIGAQNYTGLPPLNNSLSDARAMTTALQAKGFQVKSLYDPRK